MPPKAARQPLTIANSNIPTKTTVPGAEKAKPKPATKRKAAEIEEPQEVPEIGDDDPRLRFVDDNCNQVRSKINNFINSGAMKVGEFQKTLGVSSQAYSRFMGQTGPEKGMGCDTYYEAWKFFKKRQLQGIKLPKKKVKKEDEEKKLDVSGIHLDGESDGEVEVYETCDSMRTKMRALLREPGISQAGFLRAASGCLPDNKKVSSAALTAFLGKKGPSAGNTSCAFYASYCLFEKMRIRDNKPKSEFRLDMEEVWDGTGPDYDRLGQPGFDTKRLSSRRSYIVLPGMQVGEDEYGQVSIV